MVAPERYFQRVIFYQFVRNYFQVVAVRQPKYYPTLSIRRKVQGHGQKPFSQHTRSLRSSITPGTVLIMLAGAFRGKRVVFLKQLASGLLLVTGPFKVNGVPMRRCTASACIATSTKLDISGVSVPEHVNDAYFKRAAAPKKTEDGIFEQNEAKYTVSIPLFFSPILTRAKFKLNSFRPLNKERPTKRLSMPVFCPPSPLTNS